MMMTETVKEVGLLPLRQHLPLGPHLQPQQLPQIIPRPQLLQVIPRPQLADPPRLQQLLEVHPRQLYRYPTSVYDNAMRRLLLNFFSGRIELLLSIPALAILLLLLLLSSIPSFVTATSNMVGSIDCHDDPTSVIISCTDDPDTNTNLGEGVIDAEIPSIVGTIPFP
jgi:hypothetical protein